MLEMFTDRETAELVIQVDTQAALSLSTLVNQTWLCPSQQRHTYAVCSMPVSEVSGKD